MTWPCHTQTACHLTSSSAGTQVPEKSALDYHVHFFNKYQFKSTLTPLCYLLLCSAAVTQSLSLLFLSFVLSCFSACLCFRVSLPFEFRFLPNAEALLPPFFPSLLFASLSTFLCKSPRHSPPLDVPNSQVFSRNPELFLISPYICLPHSSPCRARSQMLPVLPACWQITVGMCHS